MAPVDLRLVLAVNIQSIVMLVLQCVSICSSHIDKCVANRGRLFLEGHNNITSSVIIMTCLNYLGFINCVPNVTLYLQLLANA